MRRKYCCHRSLKCAYCEAARRFKQLRQSGALSTRRVKMHHLIQMTEVTATYGEGS